MMIKGNNPENIRVGSTLSTDEFSAHRFDFMLSNPPYGKSWSSEVKYIKDGKDVIDPRFQVELTDYWGNKETVDATPRSSDGQLLFLMEMVNKMKPVGTSPIGSRIASVHNGSSLFTGDAGSGESNIRRYIIENDMLDTIIQLPNNLFYNTGITTYIWLLTNAKPEARKGKVQLIDANLLYRKLRKNLGDKNCEFSRRSHPADHRRLPGLRAHRARDRRQQRPRRHRRQGLRQRGFRLPQGHHRAPRPAPRRLQRRAHRAPALRQVPARADGMALGRAWRQGLRVRLPERAGQSHHRSGARNRASP